VPFTRFVRGKVAALVVFGLAAGASAAVPDLQTPGSGPLTVEETPGDRVKVTTDHWRMEFDLRNGGALDSIVFFHGSGKNVLVQPFRTYMDAWSDYDAPRTTFHSSRQGSVATLEFTGALGAPGRTEGPAQFHTVWTISPLTVRVDQTLRLSSDVSATTVGIGSTAVRGDLNEYGIRTGPADLPDGGKTIAASYGKSARTGAVLIGEHHAPLYLIFFHRYLEGIDFSTGSDLASWESGLTQRAGVGRFEAKPSEDGSAIEIRREPLALLSPATIRKGEYTFSYYLGLPAIVEKSNRKWRHVAFGHHPWPSDDLIRRWSESGVNIARLHNDYVADENFWHDGAWPPYDEKGMAELRRVIATCHRYGIQIVPYFSIHEFHPTAQGYAENEQQWKRSVDQAGTVLHNHIRQGEYGAQMCLQSGWLARREADVEKAYRELNFDGIYYDWGASLPCNNKNHNAKWHTGTDGMIELLAWTRRLISPRGTLILHLSGWYPSIAYENYGDLIVNMEESASGERMPRMDEMALMSVLVESAPRSPCPWGGPADQLVAHNKNNIAQMAVLGLFPWSLQDGPAADETFKLFRAFQPYKLEDYRLFNADSGAVRSAWPDVFGAMYSSESQALVVVSNTSGEHRKNVMWRVRPESLGFGRSATVTVKDTASGRSVAEPWSALEDGSMSTELDGYEYRLFEIHPSR
jgi:hypothetical protein